MPHYRISYYYMAQGMPKPDRRDHGIVFANSPDEAKYLVASEHTSVPESIEFMLGCLSAKIVRDPPPSRPVCPRIIAVSTEYHSKDGRYQLAWRNEVARQMSRANGCIASRDGVKAALAITWCEERNEPYTVIAMPGKGYYVKRGAIQCELTQEGDKGGGT